jgi:general stress protein 26
MVASSARQVGPPRVTSELVLRTLRAQHFMVLATVGEDGMPHAAGVNYGVSHPGRALALYIMTRTHLRKARDIARHPQVSVVVPVARRFLWFLPPATIQVSGHAEILEWTDAEGTAVFERFWMGRRILAAYRASQRRGETRICFVKITPDSVISTYMVGYSAWELRTHMESGAGKVVIPAAYRAPASASPSPQP